MSTVDFMPDQEAFLSRFFGPGNQLRWSAYVGREMAESTRELLTPLIQDCRNGNLPVLLPRVRESTPATIEWYAMTTDARESRALREQLSAFIGPTYTDFTGQYATLDPADSVECAVAERFSPYVFRLRVIKSADRERVRNLVFLLRSFRERCPKRITRTVHPVGRLLRDLEMALLVRNETSAWQCLDDLRSRGRLSAHNLAFLKVRILATFERWHDILSLPEKSSLLTIRRPALVTQALVQAIYNVHLAEFEPSMDVAACVRRFREIEPSVGTLFRARGELHDQSVLKAFLVRAVAAHPPHPEVVTAIAEDFQTGDVSRTWVDALLAFAVSQAASVSPAPERPTAKDFFTDARTACEEGDYDRAFKLLLECRPTPMVIGQLLACSLEIDSLDASRRALHFVEQCPEDARTTALSMRAYRRIWETLTDRVAPNETELSANQIPNGWLQWIERLNELGSWPGAAEIARYGSAEWSISEFLADPAQVTRFAGLLVASRPPDGDTVLRNAVPELLKSYLPDGEPIREFKPIYLNLAYILAVDDAIGADDLTALASLAESILESAPSHSTQSGTNEFLEILETLEAAWSHVQAPRHIDWALQVLDLLIAFNVRQHAPVDRFLDQILQSFRHWSRRIRPDQWDLMDELAQDLGQSGLLTGLRPTAGGLADDTPTIFNRLNGQSVAIYTLTVRLGRRAADVITKCFEGVRVHLIHDKASTDRLKQLAESADIFIVNTWDAKHAATNAISQRRSSRQTTLFPASKSAGSIIRALYTFLEGQ